MIISLEYHYSFVIFALFDRYTLASAPVLWSLYGLNTLDVMIERKNNNSMYNAVNMSCLILGHGKCFSSVFALSFSVKVSFSPCMYVPGVYVCSEEPRNIYINSALTCMAWIRPPCIVYPDLRSDPTVP